MRYYVIIDAERPDPAEPWSLFRTPDRGGPPMELLDPLTDDWEDTPALVELFAGGELGAHEIGPGDVDQVRDWLRTGGDDAPEFKDLVRTEQGAHHYGLPIGATITRDAVERAQGAVSGERLLVPSAEGLRKATPEDRRRLKVPPAWTDVEVADDPDAPLQCRAHDTKGRPKALYTDAYHEQQAALKFARVRELHDILPGLDAALADDAATDDTAAAVLLIRRMGLRPGSMADTKADVQAYGATTLLAQHVVPATGTEPMYLDFIAKEGKHLRLPVHDPEVAAALTARAKGKKPGDRLFATSEPKALGYLKAHTGEKFKIKDLRTYHANALALAAMVGLEPPKTIGEYRKMRKAVAVTVSDALGNEPAMALKAYINPAVFTAWHKEPSWSRI